MLSQYILQIWYTCLYIPQDINHSHNILLLLLFADHVKKNQNDIQFLPSSLGAVNEIYYIQQNQIMNNSKSRPVYKKKHLDHTRY